MNRKPGDISPDRSSVKATPCSPRLGVLDFEAVGYTANRSRFLSSLLLASMLEKVRHGEKFHMTDEPGK